MSNGQDTVGQEFAQAEIATGEKPPVGKKHPGKRRLGKRRIRDYVYHGRVKNLPRSTAKIVRIFLSSTFTDTTTERNLLMKNVFPELRRYCRDKYDVDFQVRVVGLN